MDAHLPRQLFVGVILDVNEGLEQVNAGDGDDGADELHLEVGEIHMPHPGRPVFMIAAINLRYEVLIASKNNDDQQVGEQRQVHQQQDADDDIALARHNLSHEVQAELPQWLIDKLQSSMTDADILALGRSMQQPAALDLRVNTLLATRDEVLLALQAEGMDAQPTPYSPIGIRLKDKPALTRHSLFLSGKIEIQDEGSQLLGYLLAPRRNEMVVDFCAGAGGKTLMLGAMMNSGGRLYAFDISEKRLANLKPRLKRSGLSNLHPQLIAHENDSKVKRLAGKIDRVLVDSPCSGLGTLRRSPDIKFRQSPQSLIEVKHKQTAILIAASKLLKPGGRLVYATCSFLPEENRAIVDSFLAAHPEFILRPAGEILAQQKIPLEAGECLQLLPQLHGTDAFFAAVLERIKTVPQGETVLIKTSAEVE